MSDGEIFFVIHSGMRFTAFIRHLPNLTAAELEELKGLNPISKHQLEEEAMRVRFLQGDDSAASEMSHGHHH
jgi:hypothetical protein